MQTYPVDIDPGQVVRWIMAECQAAPSTLRISARRTCEVQEIPVRKELHLGDEEREDLTEIATIATLEVAPVHATEGWTLKVVVEDESGPRPAQSGTEVEDEQTIDAGSFYNAFIRPGRGNATVIAEVENAAAEKHMTDLLRAIETNRHTPARRKPGGKLRDPKNAHTGDR